MPWKDIIAAFSRNTPLGVVVLGLALFLIAAASGVPYFQLQINELYWRLALAILALFVVIGGALLFWTKGSDEAPVVEKCNFKITSVDHNGEIELHGTHEQPGQKNYYDLRGSYDHKPPAGYSVGIAELQDPGANTRYRLRKIVTIDDDHTWRVRDVWGGDKPGLELTIAVIIFGRGGKALWDYWEKVGAGKRPSIDNMTPDTHVAHRIRVRTRVA